MLERKKPFEQLGIDFEEQERHKEAEYAKLDRMVRYATTRHCRQLEILDYFGDPTRHDCGTCDNCKVKSASGIRKQSAAAASSSQTPQQADACRSPGDFSQSPQIFDAVRIVLSGVARMKGRYGKQMVARMLVGSKAKDVAKFKLNTLSTFGLLAPLKEAEAIGLIDALLAARLLQQVEENPYRPLVRLTPRGEEVMKGTSSLDEALALDDQLLLRLRALAPRSQEQKKQPATAPVTSAQPCRDDEGFDAANAMLAGGDDEVAGDVVAPPSAPTGIQPPHYWTLRVLAGGFSAEECLQIRALDRATLVKHVLAIAREGGEWQLNWIFAHERQAALDRLMSNGAAQSLAAVLSRLPPGITAEEAELFWLAWHVSSTSKL
jgi:ATP-dependent DNA helicase RecQ